MCAAVAPEMKLLSWYPSICPTLFIKVWKLINFRREARRRLGYRIIPASILFSSLFRGLWWCNICARISRQIQSHWKVGRQTNISKRAQRILISSKDEGILYNIYREKTAASSTATHTRFSLNWIIIIRPGLLLLLLMEETDWGLHILKKKENCFCSSPRRIKSSKRAEGRIKKINKNVSGGGIERKISRWRRSW